MTAKEFMLKQIEKLEISIEQAEKRGDKGAVKNLKEKIRYYAEAVKALRKVE